MKTNTSFSNPIELLLSKLGRSYDDEEIKLALKELTSLCYQDRSYSLDLYRKGYFIWLNSIDSNDLDLFDNALKVISASCEHKDFVISCINTRVQSDSEIDCLNEKIQIIDENSKKINLKSICRLSCSLDPLTSESSLIILYKLINKIPFFSSDYSTENSFEKNLYLDKKSVEIIIESLIQLIEGESFKLSNKSLAVTLLNSFLSETPYSLENLNEKKNSNNQNSNLQKSITIKPESFQKRSNYYIKIALNKNSFSRIVTALNFDDLNYKKQIIILLVLLIDSMSQSNLESNLEKYLYVDENILKVEENYSLQQMQFFYLQTCIQNALLLSKNSDSAIKFFEKSSGINRLLALISSNNLKFQEAAAEVVTLIASNESTVPFLSSLFESGVLQRLMSMSTSPSIKTAAASVITKLSIRAKAFTKNSYELDTILNISLEIIKKYSNLYPMPHVNLKNKLEKNSANIKSIFESSGSKSIVRTPPPPQENSFDFKTFVDIVALERSYEILAALSSRSHVKQELIHGSSRVAIAIPYLWSIDLTKIISLEQGDFNQELCKSKIKNSTIVYSILHIIHSISITNKELQKKALADKEISIEEFEQLQKLQQVKTTDEHDNLIEEKVGDEKFDDDSEVLCRERVKKLVSFGAVNFIISLLTLYSDLLSNKCVEIAFEALCQIAIEESTRGVMIQQGVISVCCQYKYKEKTSSSKESLTALHTLAKICISINPNLIPLHHRLDTIKALLNLCKNNQASGLQQFEALISLTNLISVGEEEKNGFVAYQGINTIFYLLYTDNMMIRRVAAETLCNISSHKDFIPVICNADKLSLFMGLCQEWNQDAEEEKLVRNDSPGNFNLSPYYYTARAAAGAFATASGDPSLTICMCSIESSFVDTLHSLLASNEDELIIRTLVIIQNITGTGNYTDELIDSIKNEKKKGTKFNEEDSKKIENILIEWESISSAGRKASELIIKNNIINLFQPLISSLNHPEYQEIVKTIIQNISKHAN